MLSGIGVQIDKCLKRGIPPPAIAAGLKAWTDSDSWSPTQIPNSVHKANNRSKPTNGKPTERRSATTTPSPNYSRRSRPQNVTATTEDLTNAAEALKLAAILDDRAPKADKARITGWGEQIHRHHLGREDLLDGLQRFYDSPSDRAIAIGDLIAHARACRRDRTEREG